MEIETSAYKKVACYLMFPWDYPRSLITNLYFFRVEIETSAYKKVACCLMFLGTIPAPISQTYISSRVEIETSAYKKVACCLMFPSDYPRSLILVELKSKTLAARLLAGLTRVAEDEARKFLGRPQVQCFWASRIRIRNYLCGSGSFPSTSQKN
jgi:hypothetical protein